MRHYSAHAAPALLPSVQFFYNSIENNAFVRESNDLRNCFGYVVYGAGSRVSHFRVQGVHNGGKNTCTVPGGRRFTAWCDAASMSISSDEFVNRRFSRYIFEFSLLTNRLIHSQR